MVLELAERPIHEAWEYAVFEVEHMCGEGGQARWENAEEDEACGLGIEVVIHRVYEG
jgi:hypothetical protein